MSIPSNDDDVNKTLHALSLTTNNIIEYNNMRPPFRAGRGGGGRGGGRGRGGGGRGGGRFQRDEGPPDQVVGALLLVVLLVC